MQHPPFEIRANRVDVVAGRIAPATIRVENGVICQIDSISSADGYVMPGFVDSHVHIESSMLLPSQFARMAVTHGTVATVSDPHEIANVCGIAGVELMLRDAAKTCFQFHFGAPACVPATGFETAGATLDVKAVQALLADPRINHLSEVMDFPGVLSRDTRVMEKIAAAKRLGKPIDGHAPGLRGEAIQRYVAAGITTDHECVSLEEAYDRIRVGCRVAIREGSAARNFDVLQPLIDEYPEAVMLCSDDKHPDELMVGHIDRLLARAVAAGSDPMNAIRAASLNPVRHYQLPTGLLQLGDSADFVVTDNLTDFRIRGTYIGGQSVASDGRSFLPETTIETINSFAADPIDVNALAIEAKSRRVRVIDVTDGQLITKSSTADAFVQDGFAISDPQNDLLKLAVLNRYQATPPALAFVRGFGIQRGAIASSVAHDSHNIVAVGATDEDLCSAINQVVDGRGGLSLCLGNQQHVLSLPVAGLMSTHSCDTVAKSYAILDRRTKELGCTLRAPYMTLSFLALLVIPSLKLSDRGLFDVDRFEFTSLFV